MKLRSLSLVVTLLALSLGSIGFGEEAKFGAPSDNKIYAQTLVNKVMAANPELVAGGMHVAKPGTDAYKIIATSLNVVGKPCDPSDLEVAVKGKTVINPMPAAGKFAVLLPLRDRSGKHIGGCAVQFKYRDGDDQVKLIVKAYALRDDLAKQIPDVAELFAPAK